MTAEDRDTVALGHIHPGRLRTAVRAYLRAHGGSYIASRGDNARVPKALIAEIKASL